MHTRRGLTFLEVILSFLLLSIGTGLVLGVLNFTESTIARANFRLNAIEVAHRVVLQRFDDPSELPDDSLPIQQGDRLYRWSIDEQALRSSDDGSGPTVATAVDLASADVATKLREPRLITVEVWLHDPRPGEPTGKLAELKRVWSLFSQFDEDRIMEEVMKVLAEQQDEQAGQPGTQGAGP